MIPIVSFIGHHDSGKTRLLAQVIETLTDRGLRVGAVKHAPHIAVADAPGSDSYLLRRAGARRTLLLDSDSAVLMWNLPRIDALQTDLQSLFSDCDLILVEGLKSGPFPKIEVFRRMGQVPQEPLAGQVEVLAVVSDAPLALPDGVESFSPRDHEGIADFLERTFLSSSEND